MKKQILIGMICVSCLGLTACNNVKTIQSNVHDPIIEETLLEEDFSNYSQEDIDFMETYISYIEENGFAQFCCIESSEYETELGYSNDIVQEKTQMQYPKIFEDRFQIALQTHASKAGLNQELYTVLCVLLTATTDTYADLIQNTFTHVPVTEEASQYFENAVKDQYTNVTEETLLATSGIDYGKYTENEYLTWFYTMGGNKICQESILNFLHQSK